MARGPAFSWNPKQREIFRLFIDGTAEDDLKKQFHHMDVKRVLEKVRAGHYPPDVSDEEVKAATNVKSREKGGPYVHGLVTATVTAERMVLPLQIVEFFDRWRVHTDYDRPISQWIYECCEVMTVDIMGLPPAGIIWEVSSDGKEGSGAELGEEQRGDRPAAEVGAPAGESAESEG